MARETTQLAVRLYEGQDDELIAWLASLPDEPRGATREAILRALRRGIGGIPHSTGTQAVASGGGGGADVAAIRAAVRAEIEEALHRHRLSGGSGAPRDDDDRALALLDSLAGTLLLDED